MDYKRPRISLSEANENFSICRRAIFMHILLDGYRMYHKMQTSRELSMSSISYEKAENISDLLQQMLNMDLTTKDLLLDKETYVNNSIESYNNLQEMLNTNFNETERNTIMAFYKRLFYQTPAIRFHLIGWKLYPEVLRAFLDYACGNISRKELKKCFKMLDIKKDPKRPIDTKSFRHDMLMLEALMESINSEQQNEANGMNDSEDAS